MVAVTNSSSLIDLTHDDDTGETGEMKARLQPPLMPVSSRLQREVRELEEDDESERYHGRTGSSEWQPGERGGQAPGPGGTKHMMRW